MCNGADDGHSWGEGMSSQHKPLTAERIDELRQRLTTPNSDGNIWLDEITDPQEILALISMLTPPPDAAVREYECCGNCAYGRDEESCDATTTGHDDFDGVTCSGWSPRAVQSPRLTAHSDDLAVDDFAIAMKAKLAMKRAEGRSGWDEPDECHIDFLVSLLHGHIQKGDPVDIANIAMMLWSRGLRGNGSIPRQSPRLTGEQMAVLRMLYRRLDYGRVEEREKMDALVRAAFLEAFEKEAGCESGSNWTEPKAWASSGQGRP